MARMSIKQRTLMDMERDTPGDWHLDRYADPVSSGATSDHDSLGSVLLTIWNMAQRGWVIFTVRNGDKSVADVYVKPDRSEVRIEMRGKE